MYTQCVCGVSVTVCDTHCSMDILHTHVYMHTHMRAHLLCLVEYDSYKPKLLAYNPLNMDKQLALAVSNLFMQFTFNGLEGDQRMGYGRRVDCSTHYLADSIVNLQRKSCFAQ